MLYQHTPRVYQRSAEDMSMVPTGSVRLFVGGSVYLGKGHPWWSYHQLYDVVYNNNAHRVLADDGWLVLVQTNAYQDGSVYNRYQRLLKTLGPQWTVIDEKVWQRRRADFFQVPFSHVFICRKTGQGCHRKKLNAHAGYRLGVWDYKQTQGGHKNAWPSSMCEMLVDATTSPGDVVLDSFCGTGALLQAAGLAGRKAVGFDIDPDMHKIHKTRGFRLL